MHWTDRLAIAASVASAGPLASSKGESSKKSKPNHNTVRVLKP